MLTGIISAPNPYLIAMTLAAQGLAVFPVRAKRPLTPKGVYSATSDLGLLASGPEFPHHHDDDGGGGVDGLAALAALGPALPETLTAQTPSGGRHFYFRHIAGARSRKLCADRSVEWFSTGKLVVVHVAQ